MPPFAGSADHLAYVRRVPLGVCALVTSFNHPLLIASKKISVALAAGNTAVVKPPPAAPASILRLAELMSEAGLPDGVLNVVPSVDAEAGEVLTSHPDVRKVDLTGGNATGRILGEGAGRSVKAYTAELGGNAPILVFDDAPSVDAAVNGVAFAAFVASGQTCVSAKRIIVAEGIYDEFCDKLAAKASRLRLGDPMDDTTDVGPLIHERAFATVASQVEGAIAAGAEPLAGGTKVDGASFFYPPTVLRIDSPENPAFREEIFGPVVTVSKFSTEDEAVALANNSDYGLGGAVWTSSVSRAHRVAKAVRAGVFWVNTHHRNDPAAPWGGFGASGIGRENGHEAFREYTETQTVVVRTSDEPEDWFGDADARYS